MTSRSKKKQTKTPPDVQRKITHRLQEAQDKGERMADVVTELVQQYHILRQTVNAYRFKLKAPEQVDNGVFNVDKYRRETATI